MKTTFFVWTIFSMPLFLSGCVLPDSKADRSFAAPAAWQSASVAAGADDALSQHWWESFGSSELNRIVARGMAQNYDIAAAIARVRQAEAYSRVAGAVLLPQVDANLGAARNGTLGGRGSGAGNSFSGNLSASYEIDFWGGNRAARDSALASLRASSFDQATVGLTVSAGAASLWMQVVGLRARLEIAGRNRDNAVQLLQLIESRARAGAATELESAQQRGLVATQERSLASTTQDLHEAENSLAVLLGEHLGSLPLGSTSLQQLHIPQIPALLPATLLYRRPDVAAAEARLAAADADVLVARAAMLPGLTVGGSLGFANGRLNQLAESPVFSLTAALTAPIFNAGRLAAAREVSVAIQQELLANYRSAIVAAIGDVERSLNAISGLDAQIKAQDIELAEARRAMTLAESRYRAGAETMLTVLDAQRTWFAALDLSAQLAQSRLQASVSLYKALGGGWSSAAAATDGHNKAGN